MKHFNNITTIEEAKKLYRELAKQHHPDKGGDAEIMKSINNEYDFICAKILKGENLNTDEYNNAWESSQLFKEKIDSIINVEGLTIEIVGLWIWVTGQTKINSEKLKAAGYWWASKKLAWYWRPKSAAGGRGKYSLDELKNKYGATLVNTSNYKRTTVIN
jgi:hypothetical protein